MNHHYLVTVDADTEERAEQVMAERLLPDEDYGFSYSVWYRDIASVTEDYRKIRARLARLIERCNEADSERQAENLAIAIDDLRPDVIAVADELVAALEGGELSGSPKEITKECG